MKKLLATINLCIALSPCLLEAQAAIITISYSPTFTLSGPIHGVTLGLIGTGIPSFETELGELNENRVSIESHLQYSASVNAVPSPGVVYVQDFSVLFNAALNYGLSLPPSTMSGASMCWGANGCVPTTFIPYILFSPTQSGSVVNPSLLGGAIPIRVQGTVTPGMSGATGNWTLSGQAQIQQVYTPLTTQQYIRNALNGTSGTDAQRANEAYANIIVLRETSPETSAQNLNLRDAEYWLRGYAGGRSIGSMPVDFSTIEGAFHDLANRTGPVATGIYNGKKYIDQALGRNTAGPDELPNTPVGGFSENLSGWINGIKRVPLEEAVDSISIPAMPGSNDPNSPGVPALSLQSQNGQLNAYNINVQQSQEVVYFDPIAGKFVSFGVVGNRFSGFEFVTPFTLGAVFLHVSDQIIALTAGTYYDFLYLDPTGVDGFYISGLPEFDLNGPDFTFGASFVNAGDTLVVVASGDFGSDAAVPEPSSAGIWLLTLVMFLFQSRGQIVLKRRSNM